MKKKRRIFIFYMGLVLILLLFPSWVQKQEYRQPEVDKEVREALKYVGTDMARMYRTRNIEAGEKADDRKKIALTFDDGPNSKWTPKLLDGLKERNTKATFFLIGSSAKENPEIVKRIYEEGHLIGNHTYNHVSLKEGNQEEAEEEIAMTDQVIYEITGEHTAYVRPPFGLWREGLEQKMQILPVMWNIDPLDWQSEDTGEIVQKVVTEAREGAIILLHDCYESSVLAALEIVDILTQNGYVFVTVDEILMD